MIGYPVPPCLHQDDPSAAPLVGNVKVTRQDWLTLALDVLIRDGVQQVKVLALAERMGVSRLSFYWYFKSRQERLDALLSQWEKQNTVALIHQSQLSAKTITAAVCNIQRCVFTVALFDTALDFAIRDWARRADKVRCILDQSGIRRVAALNAMLTRFGPRAEAETRARVLYFMQLGYDMANLNEPLQDQISLVSHYLYVFTGIQPLADEVTEFTAYAERHRTHGATA